MIRISRILIFSPFNPENMVRTSRHTFRRPCLLHLLTTLCASIYPFFPFFQINECLAGVWELQEYKLMAHQSKTESLKEALKAADDEISHQKSLNTQLETEVGKFCAYLLTLLRLWSIILGYTKLGRFWPKSDQI